MQSTNRPESSSDLGFADLVGENRFFFEFISFSFYRILQKVLPNLRCRGRGVLLIPGFLAGDISLVSLAGRLQTLGYRVFFSGIWCNVDCPVHILPRLEKGLRKANHKTGAKVTVIGHSLGGMYARELAWKFPDVVERAILLGAPVKNPLESTNSFLRPVFELAHSRCAGRFAKSSISPEVNHLPPKVPETLIYSKSDAIVRWQNCIESGPHVEAIEVASSHLGLPYRPEVFEIIAARLGRCSPQRSLNSLSAMRGK
jgi:alpha/beta hydrolase fold